MRPARCPASKPGMQTTTPPALPISTVSPWRTSMKIAGRINGAWNIDWTQSGDTLSFSGPSWGNTLPPGGSFSNAGFCAAK